MKNENRTDSLSYTALVDATPAQAFEAINDVGAWWTGEIQGETAKIGGEFTYRYSTFHTSKQQVTELVPNERVAWRVLDSTLTFIENQKEWNGTRMTFDIAQKGAKTEVRFTHVGLEPDHQCFDKCSGAWGKLVLENLKGLIERRARV